MDFSILPHHHTLSQNILINTLQLLQHHNDDKECNIGHNSVSDDEWSREQLAWPDHGPGNETTLSSLWACKCYSSHNF